MKNVDILLVHWKIQLLEGGSRKTNTEGLGQFANLIERFARKKGGDVFERDDTPIHTMLERYQLKC